MPLKLQHDETPQLNLTPMIDVVFQLIVFFMVATKFAELEHDVSVNLPEVPQATAMTAKPQAREIVVLADGRCLLDGQGASAEELAARLTKARDDYPGLAVIIRGDAACAFQHVAAALAACQQARIAELSVSVRVADRPVTRQ
ncbi:MAG: biopolymer transporter ExbD [Pirellulales bacterium]|nr:biopolymer transporter ExbD [Pirellulales bacterium]